MSSTHEGVLTDAAGNDIRAAKLAIPSTEKTPGDLLALPAVTGVFEVDEKVITRALPVPGSTFISAYRYGQSLWGKTCKVTARLPTGETENYFVKIVQGKLGKAMTGAEFQALTDIYAAVPGFCPKPYAWGRYGDGIDDTTNDAYFLMNEFRQIGRQPAEPEKLAAGLAALHHRSISPTGKFGYHMRSVTCQYEQAVDIWDDSWAKVFARHFGYIIELAKPLMNWPEYGVVADLTLEVVVPRLLLPLQQEGRVLKPCHLHGDCWDGNTAVDMRTGEAFIFDTGSFYGHNEYDIGNWRAPRHRVSDKRYIQSYVKHFPRSEPVEDWDARNLLYSLCFNTGNAMHIPGSDQKEVIYADMTTLCEMFCPEELEKRLKALRGAEQEGGMPAPSRAPTFCDEEPEEEEEVCD